MARIEHTLSLFIFYLQIRAVQKYNGRARMRRSSAPNTKKFRARACYYKSHPFIHQHPFLCRLLHHPAQRKNLSQRVQSHELSSHLIFQNEMELGETIRAGRPCTQKKKKLFYYPCKFFSYFMKVYSYSHLCVYDRSCIVKFLTLSMLPKQNTKPN